jgi:hypothetical protein
VEISDVSWVAEIRDNTEIFAFFLIIAYFGSRKKQLNFNEIIFKECRKLDIFKFFYYNYIKNAGITQR